MTVEASTFGTEFVALRFDVEMNDGLRYKLWMIGGPNNGLTNRFCDNNSIANNTGHQSQNNVEK